MSARSWLAAAAVASSLGVAASAGAEELRLGAALSGTYNSNFFSSTTNEEDAVSFQLGPLFELSDPDGRFRYDLSYAGGYQLYVNQSGVDAWESRARARVSYEVDSLTRVRLTDRFRDISNLRFSRQDIADADTALDPNQDRYLRNDLDLEITRVLTRRLDLTLRSGHHWIDWENNIDRNDSQAVDVGGELDYALTTTHTVGGGVSYTYQDYERALTRLGSRGDYVSTFLTWNWQIDSNIVFNARGGPVWVRADEDDTDRVKQDLYVGGKRNGKRFRAALSSCSTIPESQGAVVASTCDLDGDRIPASDLGGREDFTLAGGNRAGTQDEVTFFGGASLQMDLTEWTFLTLYQRRQSTTSGDGLASSLDHVELSAEYSPTNSRWSVFVAGAFDRRETLTKATVVDYTVIAGPDGAAQRDVAFTYVEDRSSRRDAYTAISGVRAALTPRQSVTLEFRYRRTDNRDEFGSSDGVDTYFVVLTAEYLHDAFRF